MAEAGLKLLIEVDDKGTPRVTRFQNRWEGMKNKVIGGTKSINRAWMTMKNTWGGVERQINRGLTLLKYALVGLGVAAVVVGAKFEQSMAKVASVAGASKEELNKLSLVARAWGEKTAFSASQTADAMYALASAGQRTGEIIRSVGGVLMFAGAGATSMGEAAESVVQTLKMFGLEADETNRVVNVMSAGIASSMLTADRLKESMAAVGATASAMNMSVEETVGQLGLLHNAGMLGSIAGTRLKNVLTRLAAPNTALKKLLGDVSIETHGLSGVMQRLQDVGATTGDVFKAFGRIAGPAALTFMKAGKTEMDRMTEAVTGTQKAQEMYNQQQDTTIGDFKRLKSAIEENFIAAFNAAKGSIRGTLQTLTQWVKRAKPAIVGLVITIRDFIARNKESLIILGKVIGIFGAVVAAIVLWKVILVAAITTGIFYIIKYRDKVWDAFESVGRAFEWIGNQAARLGQWLWDKIKWPFEKIAELAVKAAGIFKRVFPDAAEAVEGMAAVIADAGGGALDFVMDKSRDAGGAVAGVAEDMASGIKGAFVGAKGEINKFWDEVIASGKGAMGGLPSVGVTAEGAPSAGPPPSYDAHIKAFQEYQQKIQQEKLQADIQAYANEQEQLMRTVEFGAKYTKDWLDAKEALANETLVRIMEKENVTALEIAQAKIQYERDVANAQIENREAVWQHWQQTHFLQMAMLESLEAGYDTFFATILDKEMTGKKRREAMWKSMQQSFIRSTSEMIKYYIKSWLKAILINEAASDKFHLREKFKAAKMGAVRAYSAFASVPLIGPALGAAAAAAAFAFLMAFHKGGLVTGLGPRERIGIMEEGEYVTRRRSVTPETTPVLEYINRTGRTPATTSGPQTNINVNISTGSGEIDIDDVMEQLEDRVVPLLEDLNRRRRFSVVPA